MVKQRCDLDHTQLLEPAMQIIGGASKATSIGGLIPSNSRTGA
jgi:hypothetical protein